MDFLIEIGVLFLLFLLIAFISFSVSRISKFISNIKFQRKIESLFQKIKPIIEEFNDLKIEKLDQNIHIKYTELKEKLEMHNIKNNLKASIKNEII